MRLDDAIGFIINNTGRNLTLLLNKKFSQYGITTEQWTLLKRLDEQDGINIKELTQRVGKDQGNVTRILELLEKGGLVKRTPNPADKRSSLVFLTEEGKGITENLIPIDEELHRNALNGLSEEDLTVFKKVISKINENIKKELEK
ncbi:MarR family winged helix-turn-helix transcriptional regulator [Ureibacillus composti]